MSGGAGDFLKDVHIDYEDLVSLDERRRGNDTATCWLGWPQDSRSTRGRHSG